MILTPYELPSNGLDSNSDTVNIVGLGFQELLEYSREYESAKTPLQKYLVDYSWIKKKIPNWKTINLVDLDAIILRWKIESVSGDNEFSVNKKCPHCGHVQTLELIVDQISNFVPIECYLQCKVVLGNTEYDFVCPSLETFDEVITRTSKSGRVKDIELLKLIACFPEFSNRPNIIENLVINAKLRDIQVLKTLSSIYFKSDVTIKTKCQNCKQGDWSMGVSTLIDDPFLSLVLSAGSVEDKILVEQVRRD